MPIKRKIDRRPRDAKGLIIHAPITPANMHNLGQAHREIRRLRAENEALVPLKQELARLRASIADHLYGISIVMADSQS